MPEVPRGIGADADLDARYRMSPGFELPSVYEWNLSFARGVVCDGDGSIHPYLAGKLRQLHDLFVFEQDGVDTDGHATGKFTATGIRPRCAERIEHRGLKLPVDLFQRRAFE